MIVDSNYLQDDRLREYLAKSKTNFAVLTDYAAMEAYKNNTLNSIFRSMEILSNFPAQVIVLKGTQQVCRLSGRSAGLTRRMICANQTGGFPEFCDNLKRAKAGHSGLERQLLELGAAATAQMDRVLADVADLTIVMGDVSKEYTDEEIRIFRTGGAYTAEIARKTLKIVKDLTFSKMCNFPGGIRPPTYETLPNTFLYRHALGATVFLLNWIRTGGQKEMRPEKIRNDLVDINFTTYATYFDGVLTCDKKLVELFHEVMVLLEIMRRHVGQLKLLA